MPVHSDAILIDHEQFKEDPTGATCNPYRPDGNSDRDGECNKAYYILQLCFRQIP